MAWGVPRIGTSVIDATGNFDLIEPAGVAQGDLMVACIAYKGNAAITPPSGWVAACTAQNTGDTDTTDGIASGAMFYIVRGASAPDLTCVRTAGDVAYAKVLSYSGNHATPLDTGSSATQGAAGATPTTATFNTAQANELIVAMVAYGDQYTVTAFDAATDPTTASGATDTTTAPTAGTWIERFDANTTTGADTGIGIADAIRASAGATGTIQATVSSAAGRNAILAAAFKIAPTVYTLTPQVRAANFTGQSTVLTKDRLLSPTVRAVNFTGQSVTLKRVLRLTAVAAAVVLTGSSVLLTKDNLISPTVRAANFTGQSVSVLRDKSLTPTVASAVFTGHDVDITYTPSSGGDYALDPTVVNVNFTGQSAVLLKDKLLTPRTPEYVTYNAEVVTYNGEPITLGQPVVWEGRAVALTQSRLLTPTVASAVFTGQSVSLLRDRILTPVVSATTFTGQSVTLTRNHIISPTVGSAVFTGQSVTLTHDVPGVFTLTPLVRAVNFTGQSVTVIKDKVLNPTVGAAVFTGQSVTITYNTSYTLTPLARSMAFTGGVVDITFAGAFTLTPLVRSVVFTPYSVTMTYGEPIGYCTVTDVRGASVRVLASKDKMVDISHLAGASVRINDSME